jgi:WD40 repeat protein
MWWGDDSTVVLYNHRSLAKLNIETGELTESEDTIDLQNTSPDGRYTVTFSDAPAQWTILENESGNILATIPINGVYDSVRLNPILWSTDGQSVLLQQHGAPFYLWDGEIIYSLDTAYRHYQMDYHSGTGLVATSGVHHKIDLWNVHNGELMPFNWTAHAVDFSPDGMLLAAAGTQYVTIWDMTPYLNTTP